MPILLHDFLFRSWFEMPYHQKAQTYKNGHTEKKRQTVTQEKNSAMKNEQEGFLQCQTPTSTIRLKDKGGRIEREGMKDGE